MAGLRAGEIAELLPLVLVLGDRLWRDELLREEQRLTWFLRGVATMLFESCLRPITVDDVRAWVTEFASCRICLDHVLQRGSLWVSVGPRVVAKNAQGRLRVLRQYVPPAFAALFPPLDLTTTMQALLPLARGSEFRLAGRTEWDAEYFRERKQSNPALTVLAGHAGARG